MAITRIERWSGSARCIAIWVICQSSTSIATAQTWRVEPAARATMTATNNSGFADATETGSDLVLELIPRVAFTGRGARFKADGFVEANLLTYVNKTLPNELVPRARFDANATAIERWLYLDAGAGIEPITSDPYAPVSNGTFASLRLDTTQYRLSPYIDHAFSPTVSLLYRNDNIWTRRRAELAATDPRRDTEFHSNSFTFTQQPVPLGYSLEANQERTSYVNSSNSTFELVAVRGVLTYAFDPTLAVGAVVGRERSEFVSSIATDTIRGLRLRWRPSERTDLDASVERRFFDKGWDVRWSHRSPFLAMNVNFARKPAAQPTSFLLPAAGSDARSLFNAAYTTRYPNPAERAVVVDNAIAVLGTLATGTGTGPIEAYTDYAQVQQGATLSVAFLSPLSALTFQLYTLTSEQLRRTNSAGLSLPPSIADNTQLGGSVRFNRRLTSTFSVEALVNGEKIEGLGSAQGQATSSKSAQLTGSQAVAPKTQVFAGTRWQVSHSTVVSSAQETAVFLGIEHRF
jgi:uncharacterized protein (PEP-CTERM system associated)